MSSDATSTAYESSSHRKAFNQKGAFLMQQLKVVVKGEK